MSSNRGVPGEQRRRESAPTRESYLNISGVDEDDLDAEQESELPQLFQESMIEERVASVIFEIEIDGTLQQLSEGTR